METISKRDYQQERLSARETISKRDYQQERLSAILEVDLGEARVGIRIREFISLRGIILSRS